MKQLYNKTYEAPTAEVLVVKMESNLLESITGITSTRGTTYGDAIEEEWN